eukprot:SAG11_NODE_8315_length_1030_cov_1.312567_1_plen_92_part_00
MTVLPTIGSAEMFAKCVKKSGFKSDAASPVSSECGINLERTRLLVKRINPSVDDGNVAKLFAAADADGSGYIDFDEFVASNDKQARAPSHC